MTEYERPTIATVQATIDGLESFIRATFTDIQRQLDRVVGLPQDVAELKSDYRSLDRRVRELEDERTGGRGRIVQWVSVASVVLIGLASIVVNVLLVAKVG